MATTTDKLTPFALKNPEPGRHWDGKGLYLEVTADGKRYWRMKYRHSGKEKRLALGVYPEVSLAKARIDRDAARELLRTGTDPSESRRAKRDNDKRAARGTFGAAAAGWLDFKRKGWAPETKRKAEFVVDTYLLPKLKRRNVATLASKDVTEVLRGIADHAPDIARKARQFVQGIIRYAIREGLRDDGRILDLRESLPESEKGHIPAQTMPEGIADLLRAIHDYPSEVTRAALLTCAYTAQRPGNVTSMRWDELNLDAGEWHLSAERMKTKHAHIVPLPRQALEQLRAMQAYSADREFVFPPLARQKTPHLNRDALSSALRRMGFAGKHSTHGFRGMFRTAGRERLDLPADVLESQLAHAKKGDVAKAYDRTTFGNARRKAMQQWADYLDSLRIGGKVIAIKRKAK